MGYFDRSNRVEGEDIVKMDDAKGVGGLSMLSFDSFQAVFTREVPYFNVLEGGDLM